MSNKEAVPVVTAEELINYVTQLTRDFDLQMGKNQGDTPYHPMLVVFLGDSSTDGFLPVYSSLSQIWPQYMKELQFLEIREGDGPRYVSLSVKDGLVVKQELSEEESIFDVLSSLFDIHNHFKDLSQLLVYYVLNTSDFNSAGDFDYWKSLMDGVRSEALSTNLQQNLKVADMLILLLNEDFKHKPVANQIKDRFATKAGGSVFLLSNRLNNNAIDSSWETCYRICAALLALSNTGDGHVATTLFRDVVKTVGYAREEKPLQDISTVVVQAVTDILDSLWNGRSWDSMQQDEEFYRWLGISENGTFILLDKYVDESLKDCLPTKEQLELFPRSSCDDRTPMWQYSAQEFNEITLNAWSCYLTRLTEEVTSGAAGTKWRAAYGDMLRQEFSAGELITLSAHVDDIREKLRKLRNEPSQTEYVLDAATATMKYRLSAGSELSEELLSELASQGKEAVKLKECWDAFLATKRELFNINNVSVESYYRGVVKSHFSTVKGVERLQAFRGLRHDRELQRFLKETLREIVDGNAIFRDSFENELNTRLQAQGAAANAGGTQIIHNLTNGIPVFIQAVFNLGNPVFSAALLRTSGALNQKLRGFQYNTGSGDAVEVVDVYELNALNLLNNTLNQNT